MTELAWSAETAEDDGAFIAMSELKQPFPLRLLVRVGFGHRTPVARGVFLISESALLVAHDEIPPGGPEWMLAACGRIDVPDVGGRIQALELTKVIASKLDGQMPTDPTGGDLQFRYRKSSLTCLESLQRLVEINHDSRPPFPVRTCRLG